MSSRYRITVLSLDDVKLTFHVDIYKISEGDFVEFFDVRTQKTLKFHASRCEITDLEALRHD